MVYGEVMEKHERLVAKAFKENNIIYQQAITSSRFINKRFFSNRNDIFGVFDFIILNHNRIIFFQVTSLPNVSHKKNKIQTEFLNKLEKDKQREFDIYIITYKKEKGKILWKMIKYINDDLWVDVIILTENWYDLKKIILYLR